MIGWPAWKERRRSTMEARSEGDPLAHQSRDDACTAVRTKGSLDEAGAAKMSDHGNRFATWQLALAVVAVAGLEMATVAFVVYRGVTVESFTVCRPDGWVPESIQQIENVIPPAASEVKPRSYVGDCPEPTVAEVRFRLRGATQEVRSMIRASALRNGWTATSNGECLSKVIVGLRAGLFLQPGRSSEWGLFTEEVPQDVTDGGASKSPYYIDCVRL
ncbi:MAG: hypothetical protein U0904_04280 [Candidatus Nanopelagicales bacterium]|nr:hypothetical protein [Candidatus Nanopelagicales bacterium]